MLIGEAYDYIINGDGGQAERPSQFNLIKTGGMLAQHATLGGLTPPTALLGSRCSRGLCSNNGICDVSNDNIGDVLDFFTGLSAKSAGII